MNSSDRSEASRRPPVRDLRLVRESIEALVARAPELETRRVGVFAFQAASYELPGLFFAGPPAAHDPIRLAIFGGLHGDEPASVHAPLVFLERLLSDPARARGYALSVYPLLNPVGYERDTRFNGAGLDLNRLFWCDSVQPEVRAIEGELLSRRFDGLITLHADDTCEGVYGYTRGHLLNEALLEPALRAASRLLPRDRRPVIDGFPAHEGKIEACFDGVLSAPSGQRPRPFDLIFETPALASLDDQVEAMVAALDAIIEEYRVFLAYAQDL